MKRHTRKSLGTEGLSAKPFDVGNLAHAGGHKRTRHKGRKAMSSRFAHMKRSG